MHPLLPFPKTSKILAVESHADNIGYQCGGVDNRVARNFKQRYSWYEYLNHIYM